MSMRRVISCVVGRGCLLLPVRSDKTLLVFALLHFVLQGQIFLLLQVSLDKPVAGLTKKKREKIQVTKRGNITTDFIEIKKL